MYRYCELVKVPERIEVNSIEWWIIQKFSKADGSFEAVNLYDAEKNYVCEFDSMEELKFFLQGVEA